MRSRAAAATLSGAGFKDVHSMGGGIRAWKGLVAEGTPDSGMAYFSPATRPEEVMALAWYLEEGSRRFYSEAAAALEDREVQALFEELAQAEERHQAALHKLFGEVQGRPPDPEFPRSVISPEDGGDVMEGGMRVSEALTWANGKKDAEILELALSLETHSYDLYLKMEGRMKDQRSAQVFHVLSGEEKQHLESLTGFFEKRV